MRPRVSLVLVVQRGTVFFVNRHRFVTSSIRVSLHDDETLTT